MEIMWPLPEEGDTRKKLILGALQLIAEAGPDGFSAGALLARTRLSKGALYHYFRSLDELLLEAVRFRAEERLVPSERRYAEFDRLTDFLQAYFKEILAFASNPAFLNVLLYFNQKGLGNDAVRECLCQLNNRVFERLGRIIQHYYPKRIEQERLAAVASLILFTVEGVAAHGTLQQDKQRFQAVWEWLTQAIARDLAAYE